MAYKAWIGSSIACLVLWTAVVAAQEKQPNNDSIAGMPGERGIYYRSGSEWVALPSNVLMPFLDGGAAREYFSIGSRQAVAQMRGSRAAVQIRNLRPTFYVRGLSPYRGLYMVQGIQRREYRELRMPISRHFGEWAHFRAQDLREFDLQPVAAGVFSVRPRADLTPGEYAITSGPDRDDRWIQLGFEFGVAANP